MKEKVIPGNGIRPARQRLEFGYDGQSRRVVKRVLVKTSEASQWSLRQERRFLYDGWNMIAESSRGTEARWTDGTVGCPGGVRARAECPNQNRLIGMEEAASHSISGTGVSSGFARAVRLEFAYDALGRRVRKRVLDAPRNTVGVRSGVWVLKKETVFVWQDWRMLAEYVKTPEITTLQLRRSYLWGMDLVSGVYQAGMAENAAALNPAGGVGGLLWVVDYLPGQTASNRQVAPWYDGNGNILGWVENELAQVQPLHRLEYDAFGRLLVDDPVRVALTKNHRDLGATEAWLDRPAFGFSTKYEDEETGLLYYGYRYYAPELGRWVSRDPIEEQGGINLYGMVGNDEVNFVDYLGNVQVNLKFAAFIPNTLGFAVLRSPVSNVQWMPEPDPFASTWWFSTDNRANAGQKGTSRLFSITARPISKDDIGKLERRRPVFNRARSNETHRIKIVFVGNRFPLVPQYRGWQGDFDTKISSPSVSEESVEDISPCSSKITLKAEGNYPFNGAFGLMPQMFMPSIDYKVTWTLTVNSGGIEVHVEGGHNRFPAYETVINNRSVIYSFFPDSSGPSVGNLSAWQTFGPNGVTIIR
jgi:RHS repeat-associated protein